jgi:hypothetical protein
MGFVAGLAGKIEAVVSITAIFGWFAHDPCPLDQQPAFNSVKNMA